MDRGQTLNMMFCFYEEPINLLVKCARRATEFISPEFQKNDFAN